MSADPPRWYGGRCGSMSEFEEWTWSGSWEFTYRLRERQLKERGCAPCMRLAIYSNRLLPRERAAQRRGPRRWELFLTWQGHERLLGGGACRSLRDAKRRADACAASALADPRVWAYIYDPRYARCFYRLDEQTRTAQPFCTSFFYPDVGELPNGRYMEVRYLRGYRRPQPQWSVFNQFWGGTSGGSVLPEFEWAIPLTPDWLAEHRPKE